MTVMTETVDLDELNQKLGALESFMETLPEKALSLGIRVLIAIVVFFVGMKLIKLVRKIVRKSLEHLDVELGVVQFLDALIKIILYIVLFLAIASNFGIDATSVVALVGSAGVTIGLALQGSLSNLAGGILILVLKPFRVGDYIIEHSNGNEGTVKEIGIFYTKLVTGDRKIIILPNGTLANTSLTNASEAKLRRIDLSIGISYDADIKTAKEVLQRILDEDADVNRQEQTSVFVSDLGASGVVLGMRCYCENEKYWATRWRLLETVKLELDKAGIKIPYQQISVHVNQKSE